MAGRAMGMISSLSLVSLQWSFGAWQEKKWYTATVDLINAHGTDEAGRTEWNIVYQRQNNVPRAKVCTAAASVTRKSA